MYGSLSRSRGDDRIFIIYCGHALVLIVGLSWAGPAVCVETCDPASLWLSIVIIAHCDSFQACTTLFFSVCVFCFLTSLSFQGPRMFTQSCSPSGSASAAPLYKTLSRVLRSGWEEGRLWFFVCSLDRNWAIRALTSVLTYCFESHRSCGLLLYTYMAFRLAGTGWARVSDIMN